MRAASHLFIIALGAQVCACAEPGQAQRAAAAASAQAGEELIRQLGCGICHADLPRNSAFGRTPIPAISVDSAYAVLRRRPSPERVPRMPDFHLDEWEALALALYIGTGEPKPELRRAARADTAIRAERGARIFTALNCAGCHTRDGHAPAAAGPLLSWEGSRVRSDWLRAYLEAPHAVRPFGTRPGSGARMPDFALTRAEAESIAAFLMGRTRPLPAFEPEPLTAAGVKRIDALLETRWSCLGCHAWAGRGGRVAPDLARAGMRLQPAFLRAMLERPHELAPGTIMPRAPYPPAMLDRIASRLLRHQAGAPGTDTPRRGYLSLIAHEPIEFPADSATSLYAQYCAACHGVNGDGRGYNAAHLRVTPAAHTDSAAMSGRPDDTLYDAIAAGGFFLGRSPEMPGFADLMPAQIRTLVARIRTLCRCAPPPWSRDGGA